jgi:hypothetical protein
MIKTNGEWQKPENLGKEINTAYDEISPMLTKGSRLLFYSSNRLEGLGGFDIFYSSYATSNLSWVKGKNLGSPINTTCDDKELFISADGTQGVFSSNRKGGLGGFDLYLIYFKDQITDQMEYIELPYFIADKQPIQTDSTEGDVIKIVVDNTQLNSPNLPIREFINMPISYTNEEVSTPGLAMIKDIREIMKIYPDLSVTLLVSGVPKALPEFDLFQTLKVGQKISQTLMRDKTIKSDRISSDLVATFLSPPMMGHLPLAT